MAERQISVRLAVEGAEQARQQLEAIKGAARGAAEGAAPSAAAVRSWEALNRQYGENYKAAEQYARAVTRVEAAEKAGIGTSAQRQQLLENAAMAYARASGIATEASGKLGGAVQQAGLQIGDFATQIASGGNATTALAQQLPQLLTAFGAFGAVAGAGVAIAAAIVQFQDGKTEAEKFQEALESLEATYRDNLDRASKLEEGLKRLNAQYLTAADAGSRYRAGLQEEGANVVRLAEYYARLTEAQRAVVQRGDARAQTELQTRGRGLMNEVTGPIAGTIDRLAGPQVSPLNMGFIDTTDTAAGMSGPLREAAEAVRAFREQGVLTVEGVSQLVVRLRELQASGSEGSRVISNQAEALEAALPRVRDYEAALRRLGVSQAAMTANAPVVVAERGRTAIEEVGGVFQQRRRLLGQRDQIRAFLDQRPEDLPPEQRPSADERRAAASSLQSIQGQLEGLTPATEQFLRSLREQVKLSRHAEGAARDLAAAEQQISEAARQAGQGQASASAVTEARRLVQERLNEEFTTYRVQLSDTTNGILRQAEAMVRGERAAEDARIAVQAETEAKRFAEKGTEEYEKRVRLLTGSLQEQRDAQERLRNEQALADQGRQLEQLEVEARLIGATVVERERELAVLRERQRILGSGGDIDTDEARERLSNAARIAEATTELRRQQDAYGELANAGRQAFEQVGDAIVDAFARGEQSSIRFGDISRAIAASLAQTFLRLAVVNPINNAVFGTNAGTLGDLTGSGGTGSMLGSLGNLSGLSNLLPGGISSAMSAPILGSSALASSTNAALAGMGGMYGPATAAQVNAASGVGALGTATWGQALGAAAGGYMIGSTVGGFVAGDSAARQTNAQIGAAAGTAIGFAVGGPIGAMIGGTLGGAGGGLIGPGRGFMGGDAIIRVDPDTGLLGVSHYTGKGQDDAGQAQLMQSAAQQVAALNAQLSAAGLRITQGNVLAIGGGESGNPRDIVDAMARWNVGGLTSDNANIATAVQGRGIKEAIEAANWITQIYEPLVKAAEAAADPAAAYAQQIEAINEKWDAATAKARELGQATAVLEQARHREIEAVRQQEEMARKQEEMARLNKRGDGLELGLRQSRVLGDYLSGLDLTTGSPETQLAAAQERLQAAVSAARAAGSTGADLSRVTSAAESVRQASSAYYASGPQAAAMDGWMRSMLDGLGRELDLFGFRDDLPAQMDRWEKKAADQRDETNRRVAALEEEIRGLRIVLQARAA